MRNYLGYIIDYSEGNLSDQKRKWFEGELSHNEELRKEYSLFMDVNGYMRGKQDIEEVLSDPNLGSVSNQTNQMVDEFNQERDKYNSNRNFVKKALTNKENIELHTELTYIKRDAENLGVNEVTKQWVDEWTTKNQNTDPANESRKAFISDSLQNIPISNKPRSNRQLYVWVASLAVAASVALFVLFKFNSPSSNPEDIYQEFYKPLNALSTTTRNSTTNSNIFSNAIELYNQGRYNTAAALFSELIIKEPKVIANRFFYGISLMEQRDCKQAILLLNDVVSNNGEYKKEAQWYLGLSYLKTNEIEKAIPLFEDLLKTKGYYQSQAQTILDRLR